MTHEPDIRKHLKKENSLLYMVISPPMNVESTSEVSPKQDMTISPNDDGTVSTQNYLERVL